MVSAICFIFFLSGASALIFELLWFQLSGHTFGNSIWSTTIVLSSFMGGLALGNSLSAFWGGKIKNPIRLYAKLELLIGLSGLSLVLGFPMLTDFFAPVFQVVIDQPAILNLIRSASAFFLLIIPTTAMGATLPILIKALSSRGTVLGRPLGLLYGWNTIGATAGVLLSELFLVKWLGLMGTGCFAASFNLIAAAVAFRLSGVKPPENETAPITHSVHNGIWSNLNPGSSRLLLSSFISGFSILALEVIWFRFIILFYPPHSLNFAVMLAIVLAGISLGGFVASRWYAKNHQAHSFLFPVVSLNGVILLLLYSNFGFLLQFIQRLNESLQIAIVSIFLMFAVCFFSGIIYTMIGNVLQAFFKSKIRTTGLLTLSNTVGGMLGSIFAGLVFLPTLGIEKSFFLIAIFYFMMLVLLFDRKQNRIPCKPSVQYLSMAVLLGSLAVYPFGLMEKHYSTLLHGKNIHAAGEKRVAYRETLTETIQYYEKSILGRPHYHRLVTNSYSMSGTHPIPKRYMKLYVYLPLALNPKMENALLICYGSGSTARALTDTGQLKRIDIVDISEDIIEMSHIVYPRPEDNPVKDPRVGIHVEDGRFFLLTTKRQYDLITAEPPPPNYSGIVNLYTQEYFQLIYDRLSENGMVTYWLPVDQLQMRDTRAIIKGFKNVFENTTLWTGAGLNWMVLGIKGKPERATSDDFAAQWRDPSVGEELRKLGIPRPEHMGALFIADGNVLDGWVGNVPPLKDNFPKRLSHPHFLPKEDFDRYWLLMDPVETVNRFSKSENIRRLWPPALRKDGEKYFAVQNTVNSFFDIYLNTALSAQRLHRCIENPLLNHFVYFALNSDYYAQAILDIALKDGRITIDSPELCFHLAARYAFLKDYMASEKYLQIASRFYRFENVPEDLFFTRIYLLHIAGEKNRAGQLGRAYINRSPDNRRKREERVASLSKWLDQLPEK